MGVSLTGTITGATWLGERTISFDSDEAKAAAVAAAVDAKIALADVDAISDWRLPMATELNAIYAASDDINAAFDTDVNPAGNYLFEATGSILYRSLSGGDGAENFPANARVRPVVTVTINKE